MHMLIHFLMLTRFSDRTYADPLPLIINMLTRFTDSLFIISDRQRADNGVGNYTKRIKRKKKKKKQLVSTTGTGLLTCLYGNGLNFLTTFFFTGES